MFVVNVKWFPMAGGGVYRKTLPNERACQPVLSVLEACVLREPCDRMQRGNTIFIHFFLHISLLSICRAGISTGDTFRSCLFQDFSLITTSKVNHKYHFLFTNLISTDSCSTWNNGSFISWENFSFPILKCVVPFFCSKEVSHLASSNTIKLEEEKILEVAKQMINSNAVALFSYGMSRCSPIHTCSLI